MPRPPFRYAACGLTLACDTPVAGLPRADDAPADVDVWLHDGAPIPLPDASDDVWYSSPYLDAASQPVLLATRNPHGGTWLRYSEGAVFRVDRGAHRVDAWWTPPLTAVDAASYLVGPVLAFVLRLRDRVPLHASGVAIDGRAVLFAGDPGAGKSTTAAAFASLGFPVLSDDIVPLAPTSAGPLAWPGHPRVGLWDDSAAALFTGQAPLPPYSDSYTKRYLDLDGGRLRFQPTPLPLGAVFVFDSEEQTEGRALRPLGQCEALVTLVRHTYGSYLIDMFHRGRELDVLAGVVRAVPVWRLCFGATLGDLTRQCLTLAHHVRHTIYRGVKPEAGLPV